MLRGSWSLLAALYFVTLANAVHAAEEAARSEVYAVVEIPFKGPQQRATDSPARDVSLSVRLRHESGQPEYTIPGFWDGDGQGGSAGDVFKVRFCPTKPGRWELAEVKSNAKELDGQHQGEHIVATASKLPGFWEVDAESAGRRWYRRSDGSHPYVLGNTEYNFLSGYRDTGAIPGFDIAADIAANAGHFKKLRFGLSGDRYPHPTDKAFLDDAGRPTDDGNFSHRPNPRWFHQRVDAAVRAGLAHDLVTDLILCGPDTEASRSTLRAGANKNDPTPWLRYIAARYGSFPNVWICLCNEYDIKKPKYTDKQIVQWGRAMDGFLAYPTQLSVHASPYPYGNKKKEDSRPAWSAELDVEPWADHQILQRKIRKIAPAADVIQQTWKNSGGQPREKPTIDDELSYQGDGDKHSEADTVAAHLGAFLGGGYGSTGWKPGNKLGHYFWGGFTPAEHTAAAGLKYLRETIDRNISFWKMAPDTAAFPNLDPAFRAMAWEGHEYVLGTDKSAQVVVKLPAGEWTVKQYDLLTQKEKTLTEKGAEKLTIDAPESRAVLFHFKKNGA